MQNGGDYFVRLDAAPTARHAPVERGASAYSYSPSSSSTSTYEPPKKRKRSGVRIRVMPLLLLAALGYLGWLQTQPGGVSGHVNDWIDKVRGGVESASANPDLKRASEYFNGLY